VKMSRRIDAFTRGECIATPVETSGTPCSLSPGEI
jgi:hypothetical protein